MYEEIKPVDQPFFWKLSLRALEIYNGPSSSRAAKYSKSNHGDGDLFHWHQLTISRNNNNNINPHQLLNIKALECYFWFCDFYKLYTFAFVP